MTQKLSDYIGRERVKFTDVVGNDFAFSWYQVQRYDGFLRMTLDRYNDEVGELTKLTDQYKASIAERREHTRTTALTEEQQELWRQASMQENRVQMDMESFYTFARILLDRIAAAIKFYFGMQRMSYSFNDFRKRIADIASAEALDLPDEFVTQTGSIYEQVAPFRDKQITHSQAASAWATMIRDDEGKIRMAAGPLFVRDVEEKGHSLTEDELQKELRRHYKVSQDPNELMQKIEEYIDRIVDFIEANKAKTCLTVR